MTFKEDALQRHVYEIDSPWFLPDGWWNVRKGKEGRLNEGRNRRVNSTKSTQSTVAPVIPLLFIGHVACQTTFVEELFASTLPRLLRYCVYCVVSLQQQKRHAQYPQVRAWDRYASTAMPGLEIVKSELREQYYSTHRCVLVDRRSGCKG
jgi:hypothetical protein